MKKVIIIGVCGGSGSGKTTFSRELRERLGRENAGILYQDSYYKDQSHKFDGDGGAVNFDHPSAIDFELMATQLDNLAKGLDIEVPIYDFNTHTRKSETTNFPSKKIIILDGILIFSQDKIRPYLDELVFIDVAEEIRFERRLKRDIEERGRTPEGVKKQFELQVKPMHDKFVEPSKKYASHTCDNDESLKVLVEIEKKLSF